MKRISFAGTGLKNPFALMYRRASGRRGVEQPRPFMLRYLSTNGLKSAAHLLTGSIFAAAFMFFAAHAAAAEISEVKVARQFGISFLPMLVMQEKKLFEKHAKAAGLDATATYMQLSGGTTMNDSLLSKSIEVASGGVAAVRGLLGAHARHEQRSEGDDRQELRADPAAHARAAHQVDRRLHREGQDRDAGDQGLRPGDRSADGHGEGVRQGHGVQVRQPAGRVADTGRARRR